MSPTPRSGVEQAMVLGEGIALDAPPGVGKNIAQYCHAMVCDRLIASPYCLMSMRRRSCAHSSGLPVISSRTVVVQFGI